METEFKLLCLWVVLFLVWNITLIRVDNKYDLQIRGHTSGNVIQQFARLQGIADEKVVLYKYDGHVRKYSRDILLSGGRWSIGARPVSGDHIHAAISFWIGDVPDRRHLLRFPNSLRDEEAINVSCTRQECIYKVMASCGRAYAL